MKIDDNSFFNRSEAQSQNVNNQTNQELKLTLVEFKDLCLKMRHENVEVLDFFARKVVQLVFLSRGEETC
jgi:hypothetical protein